MRLPPPRVTVALVFITVAAWLGAAAIGGGPWAAMAGGFVPARWSGMVLPGAAPAFLTPLTATLVHAGALHLGFNMLMLGFCGRFVEASLRGRGLILLYVAGAYAAAAAQWLAAPLSIDPVIGTSGGISAIVAAYALLYGDRRVPARRRWLADAIQVVWLAAAWIGLQLMIGVAVRGAQPVAVFAHIGGFLSGLILARPLLRLSFHSRRRPAG